MDAGPLLPLFNEPVEKAGRSKWTPEMDADLKRMFADGKSYGTMAKHFPGYSRNAVIGRAHRLGLGGRMEARPAQARRVPSLRRPARRKGSVKRLFDADGPEIVDLPPDFSEFAITLMEAKDHHCRYPIGDPRQINDFKFCGADVAKGLSYCTRHCRIVFEPATGGGNGRSQRSQFECSTPIDHRESRKAGGTAFRFGGRY